MILSGCYLQKRFLYTEDEFNCMFKFVIVRNPYDRIVSAWKYEYRNHLKSPLNLFLKPKRTITKYSFERYLKLIPEVWKTKSKRHFAMHCAPIWSDITDWNGNVLVDRIYKLEDISEDIDELRSKLELQHIEINHLNRNRGDNSYRQYYNRNYTRTCGGTVQR